MAQEPFQRQISQSPHIVPTRPVLQARQSRLTRQSSLGTLRMDKQPQGRILAQQIGVDGIFVAGSDLIEALSRHLCAAVLDISGIPTVLQESFEVSGQSQPLIEFAQHDQAGVTAEGTTVEVQGDAGLKLEEKRGRTLCGHRSSEVWVS